MSDQKIWQWTLTKDAIAPCFVCDVLNLRKHNGKDADFFWLGHTPCRTVLLVGMVVAIQVYDKRTIYTIDDGTAVIDCILRHPHPAPAAPALPPPPPRSAGGLSTKSNLQRPSPKKARLDNTEPPLPITDPGYPVRVVGRVMRHYQSKQIHAETIDPCASSLDEITHLERVIELHKTKYSRAIPFVPPAHQANDHVGVPKHTAHNPSCDPSTPPAGIVADASVFSSTTSTDSSTMSYTLLPPPMPLPLRSRNRPSTTLTHHTSCLTHIHVPSSPTTSSIASSTPSSPCKQPSPVKSHEAQCKPKLRHPSRLHTYDLTGNTFRLYVKHYLDNAPPPFPNSLTSPTRSTFGVLSTPTKRRQDKDGGDEPTPRPRPIAGNDTCDDAEDGLRLGFTLSHLRRVPELALLAARVVRAEKRKRDKADRDKQRTSHNSRGSTSNSTSTKVNENTSLADSPRKKMKRLFSWAVVKLHEEGSIVLWDGDVRPLPVPPPPLPQGIGDQNQDLSELWRGDETSCSRSYAQSTLTDLSASVLYTSSASASLYSQYQAPRRPGYRAGDEHDVDLGYVSDPEVNEEAYVPLTPRLLAGYVNEAVGALRRGRWRGTAGVDGRGTKPTPESVLAYLKRTDGRWVGVGLWAVEEALAVLNAG